MPHYVIDIEGDKIPVDSDGPLSSEELQSLAAQYITKTSKPTKGASIAAGVGAGMDAGLVPAQQQANKAVASLNDVGMPPMGGLGTLAPELTGTPTSGITQDLGFGDVPHPTGYGVTLDRAGHPIIAKKPQGAPGKEWFDKANVMSQDPTYVAKVFADMKARGITPPTGNDAQDALTGFGQVQNWLGDLVNKIPGSKQLGVVNAAINPMTAGGVAKDFAQTALDTGDFKKAASAAGKTASESFGRDAAGAILFPVDVATDGFVLFSHDATPLQRTGAAANIFLKVVAPELLHAYGPSILGKLTETPQFQAFKGSIETKAATKLGPEFDAAVQSHLNEMGKGWKQGDPLGVQFRPKLPGSEPAIEPGNGTLQGAVSDLGQAGTLRTKTPVEPTSFNDKGLERWNTTPASIPDETLSPLRVAQRQREALLEKTGQHPSNEDVPIFAENIKRVAQSQTGTPIELHGFRGKTPGAPTVSDGGVFYGVTDELARGYSPSGNFARGIGEIESKTLKFDNPLVSNDKATLARELAANASGSLKAQLETVAQRLENGEQIHPLADKLLAKTARDMGHDGIIYRDEANRGIHPDKHYGNEGAEIVDLRREPLKPVEGFEPVTKPQTPTEAPQGVNPNATGLANQVLDRKAIEGVIDEVEKTKGKGAEYWQGEGKKAVDSGEYDPEILAKRIGDGTEELTGKKVGVLLEGQRNLENALNAAKPGEEYNAARQRLNDYLENVQQGKGRWSDVGRALQAGSELDTGNFANVISEVEKRGGTIKAGSKAEASLKDVVSKIGTKDPKTGLYPEGTVNHKLDEVTRILAEEKAKPPTSIPGSPRKFNREAVQKEIADLLQQFNETGKKTGAGTKQRGAAAKLTAEDVKAAGERVAIAGKIVKAHIKLHAGAALEDFVIAVQNTFKNAGVDIDRQAVIDLASQEGPKQTRSELAKQVEELKAQAKAESTPVKEKLAVKAEAEKAKGIADAAKKRADAAQRAFEQMEEGASKAKAKEIADRAKTVEREATARAKATEDAVLKADRERLAKAKKYTDMHEQIADLQDQLDTGNFRTPTKNERILSERMQKLQDERAILQKKVKERIEAATPRSVLQRVQGAATSILNTPRTVQATADMSFSFRQGGWTAITHPGYWVKSVLPAVKALVSEGGAVRSLRMIEEDPAFRVASKSKLYIAPLEGKLTSVEEGFMARFLEKFPVIGKVIRGSERHMVTMGNEIRFNMFKDFIEKYHDAPGSTKEAYAAYLNDMTGRGQLRGKFAGADAALSHLSTVLYSPRFSLSRWQTPFHALKLTEPLVARKAAGDLVKFAAFTFGTLKAAEAAGGTVNWDPDSPDFLQIVFGDTAFDTLAGFRPNLRLVARIAKGATLEEADRPDPSDLIGRYLKGKSSPIVSGGYALYKGKNIATGQPETREQLAHESLTPLVYQNIREAIESEGGVTPKVGAVAAGEVMGLGTSTYKRN